MDSSKIVNFFFSPKCIPNPSKKKKKTLRFLRRRKNRGGASGREGGRERERKKKKTLQGTAKNRLDNNVSQKKSLDNNAYSFALTIRYLDN